MQCDRKLGSMNILTTGVGEVNLLFLVSIPFVLFLLLILKNKNRNRRSSCTLPPGPYAWPILGNIGLQMGKNPHVTLANLARVHGPLMSLRFGTRLIVVGSSPAAAAEILKTHDRILSGRCALNGVRVKGSKIHNLSAGLFEECGESWKSVRGIYRGELFSAKAIESQVEMRESKVMEMVKYLGSKEGEMVIIKEIVFPTVLNILSNTLFSIDFMDFEGKGVGEEMWANIRRFAVLAATPQLSDFYPLGGWDFKRMYNKLMDPFEKICAPGLHILQQRRNLLGGTHHSNQRDFTDALIHKGFTNDQINPLFLEIFSAGTESTTATSEWTLVELIRNPKTMLKLRDELAKVVVGGDIVRESYLPHLPYLEACVKETLRLHPPGPLLLPHRAIQTCEVMGYTIPKDSQVMVNMWAIGRDPTIWDDPLSFNPERFLVLGLDYKGQDFEYIPFGSGRRMCAGQPLASRAVPLIVASLVHTFDWILPSDMDPIHIDMNDMVDIIMQKEEPLCVIPMLRKQLK